MKTPLLLAVAPLIALAACNQSKAPEVIDTNPDPMADQLKNAAPVELPPAIVADQTLRCKDNSLVYVTFFQGNKQAVVRTEQNGTPIRLTAPAEGQPLTAEGGWELKGTPGSITLTQPGKGALTCHT